MPEKDSGCGGQILFLGDDGEYRPFAENGCMSSVSIDLRSWLRVADWVHRVTGGGLCPSCPVTPKIEIKVDVVEDCAKRGFMPNPSYVSRDEHFNL